MVNKVINKNFHLTFFLLFFLISCGQNKPKSIEESLNYFEKNWSETEKNIFKKQPENIAVSKLHMSVGMWIRNNWISEDNNALTEEFHKIGVYHPDDISSIILTSLHRKLNNKNLKLEEQAQHFIDYWKPIIERDKKSKIRAFEIYNKRKIGDSINIYYPVNTADGESNAVIYEDNSTWAFNPKKDLKITGIVKEKFYLNHITNVFFKIQITKMSKENTNVLGQEMKVGNTYDFHLNKLTID
ncbi:MAG: hypothetical protein L6262_06120 [Weeksellaceae bacterium]|nr:hypothetical protein [Weeksellaceae bacterium]